MEYVLLKSQILVTLKYRVTDYAPPSGSTAQIPWARWDEFKDCYILPSCLPIGLKTLRLTSMGLSDVYKFYDHIILSQNLPDKQPFQFAFHDSILPSLTPLPPKTRCSLLHHRPTAPCLSCILLHMIYSLRLEVVTMEQTTKMLTMRQTPMQILVQRSTREGTIWLCYMCQLHWPSQFQQCWWRQRQNKAWSVSHSHFGWISLLKFFFPLSQ